MRYRAFAVVAACLAASAGAIAQGSLADGAKAHPPYHGERPAASDVVFSVRFTRPEALPVIKAFGATRVEWVYTQDAAFAASLKQAAGWFGGTLNGNGPLPTEAGYARDFDGNVLVAPWMKGWGGKWVTSTHPETQAFIAEMVKRYLDMGASSLQHDDPLLQYYAALNQSGDFNDSTLKGFPAWLANRANPQRVAAAGLTGFDGDYRAWLKQRYQVADSADYRKRFRTFPSTPLWLDYTRSTVVDHFERVRRQTAEARGKPLPISMNLAALYEPLEANQFFFLAPLADYSMAETHIDSLPQMVSMAATARALGMGFVPSVRPLTTAENRVAVATLYALGGQPIVPWDVYAGNDDKGQARRYFGTPEDFADLYRFVRAQRQLFDGLEPAALVGVVVAVDKAAAASVKAVVERLVSQQIPFAFIPVGGSDRRYPVEPARLRQLRMLLSVGPDSDLAAADLKLLAESQRPRRDVAAVTEAQWAELRPFLAAPGAERLRLLARASPADPNRLVVHVVDAGRGELAPADPGCRRRVGIQRSLLGPGKIASATWHSGTDGTPVAPEAGATHHFFTLQGCPMWGVLDIRLQQ